MSTGWLVVMLICSTSNDNCRVKVMDGKLFPTEMACLDKADTIPGTGCTFAEIDKAGK